jgi:hypothetical protein
MALLWSVLLARFSEQETGRGKDYSEFEDKKIEVQIFRVL